MIIFLLFYFRAFHLLLALVDRVCSVQSIHLLPVQHLFPLLHACHSHMGHILHPPKSCSRSSDPYRHQSSLNSGHSADRKLTAQQTRLQDVSRLLRRHQRRFHSVRHGRIHHRAHNTRTEAKSGEELVMTCFSISIVFFNLRLEYA